MNKRELSEILKFINALGENWFFNGGFQFYTSENEIISKSNKFVKNYKLLSKLDIIFGQDCFGDQYFIRNDLVGHLNGETGEVEFSNLILKDWFKEVKKDPEEILNIDLKQKLEKGFLLFAYPPFCTEEGSRATLKAMPEEEVIEFHIDFYKQISNLNDGDKIVFVDKSKKHDA